MPNGLPDQMQAALSQIAQNSTMNDGIEAMAGRVTDFDSPFAAKLAGTFMNPRARLSYDKALDDLFAMKTVPRTSPEIVIGSGLHAAIYCAVRVQEGHPKPLVIEAKERAGGAFAVSREATFYLNSRNRPGNLGIPGRGEALNFLPGAPVQPADLSGDEYQPNSSLAFSIRSTLAMYAEVLINHRVVDANSTSVTLDNGKVITTTRVIYATGLGAPKGPPEIDGKHMLDYMQFLARLDQPFPFQGVKSVAVVGAGDSGKTVVEALIGQGPPSRMSVSALDFVERIDWYGVPNTCLGKERWEENNRSRYKGIGRAMARNVMDGEGGMREVRLDTEARLKSIQRKAESYAVGFDGAYVDGARYDLVVIASGFTPMDVSGMIEYKVGGRSVARMGESGVFTIGPAAQIAEVKEANVETGIPENSVALFRYADLTAAFAMSLPLFELPASESKPRSILLGVDDLTKVVTKETAKERGRTVKGKDNKRYKVGDLIARLSPSRNGYYQRGEQRGKVLTIEGSTNKPKVKIRETSGYSRYVSILDTPRDWQKVERGKQINGEPVPNY